MLITNTDHGGTLRHQLTTRVQDPRTTAVKILSGYVGTETVAWLRELAESQSGLSIELICGMAYREGLSSEQYGELLALDVVLRLQDPDSRQGVYVFAAGPEGNRRRGLHGKAFLIETATGKELFIGSSNFSDSGLGGVDNQGRFSGNVEVNTLLVSSTEIYNYEIFYEELHRNHGLYGNKTSTQMTRDKWMAVPIAEIESFPIKGVARKKRELARKTPQLTRGASPSGFKTFDYVDIDLARNVEAQAGSNLNACFGKGRWQRGSGQIIPRDWYEVEIMPGSEVTRHPVYPRGEFNVRTHDGFQFRAKTGGSGYKNLRSEGDLKILGYWIKGLLEDSGALSDNPQEAVTRETFSVYGNSILRLYRVSNGNYIFNFPDDPTDL